MPANYFDKRCPSIVCNITFDNSTLKSVQTRTGRDARLLILLPEYPFRLCSLGTTRSTNANHAAPNNLLKKALTVTWLGGFACMGALAVVVGLTSCQ
mmetsp:Transcript_93683/g.214292  ORF Transcript_93683/g.214292 Transcript_93683/m.214292 type:complete len:97 (-) Transcript_93683:64-354(-)